MVFYLAVSDSDFKTSEFSTKTSEFSTLGEPTRIDEVRMFSAKHAESEIELVLVHVPSDSTSDAPWRSLEIWTNNTMYALDANLNCIETSSRNPHEPHQAGPLLGARLVGGQVRDGDHYTVSYPYPAPGMEAVFQVGERDKFITTSTVERVMLRVRMKTVETSTGAVPDWAKITTRWERK
jgi:hypothetical protein